MFRRILVPLDGSARAERALPVAAHLARRSGGTLVLLRVAPSHVPHSPIFEPPQALLAHVGDELDEARQYVANIAASDFVAGVTVEMRMLEGDPAATILEAVGTERADLVVLCRHGHTGPVRWPLGSVARKVIRHVTVPALIGHEGGNLPGGRAGASPATPRHADVALDGSPLAERAVLPAADLLEALSDGETAELRLLSIVPEDGSLEDAASYLRTLSERLTRSPLAGRSLRVIGTLRRADDVAGALLHVMEGPPHWGQGLGPDGTPVPPPDFLAMATHGRTGVQRWMLGSVTERVLQVSLAPLLIVRARS